MHQQPILRLPPERRVQRLQKWLALWLAWFTAHALAVIAPELAARTLFDLFRHVRGLLLVRALYRVRPPRRPHRPRCYDPDWVVRRLTVRSMTGMALKRALRGRTAQQQCRALCNALANADRWVAHIARRLARRFTKLRRPRHPVFHAAPLAAAHALLRCADSS
jgi:hypothetical protein